MRPHAVEAADAHRRHGRLAAAGQHHVGHAVRGCTGRVAERHRATPRRRCTARQRPARAELHRHVTPRPCWGSAPAPRTARSARCPSSNRCSWAVMQRVQPADARRDGAADAVGLGLDLEPRVLHRLAARRHRAAGRSGRCGARSSCPCTAVGSKSLTSQAILTGDSDGVEQRDRPAAGPARAQARLDLGHAGADRVDGADSGDDDPPAFHRYIPIPPSTGSDRARDVRRVVREQEPHDTRDVLGVAEARQRRLPAAAFRPAQVLGQHVGQLGRDVARRDAVDAHAARADLASPAPS